MTGFVVSTSKNHSPVAESTSRVALLPSTAAFSNALADTHSEYRPNESALALDSKVVGTSWPDARPCSTASDGHAYRLTAAPGKLNPELSVTVPVATTMPPQVAATAAFAAVTDGTEVAITTPATARALRQRVRGLGSLL
jgi:hypothetical protein